MLYIIQKVIVPKEILARSCRSVLSIDLNAFKESARLLDMTVVFAE